MIFTLKPTLAIAAQYLKQSFRSTVNILGTIVLLPILGVFAIFLAYYPATSAYDRDSVMFFCMTLVFWLSANASCTTFITDRERYVRERIRGFSVPRYYFGILFGHLLVSLLICETTVLTFYLFQRTQLFALLLQPFFQLPLNSELSPGHSYFSSILCRHLLISLYAASATGVTTGLLVSSISRTDRQALITIPIITIFLIIFSPRVAGSKDYDAEKPYKPLAEILNEEQLKALDCRIYIYDWKSNIRAACSNRLTLQSGLTQFGEDHFPERDLSGMMLTEIKNPAQRLRAFLGFMNPLRYTYNSVRIMIERHAYYSQSPGLLRKAYCLELLPLTAFWILMAGISFIFLIDPRWRHGG